MTRDDVLGALDELQRDATDAYDLERRWRYLRVRLARLSTRDAALWGDVLLELVRAGDDRYSFALGALAQEPDADVDDGLLALLATDGPGLDCRDQIALTLLRRGVYRPVVEHAVRDAARRGYLAPLAGAVAVSDRLIPLAAEALVSVLESGRDRLGDGTVQCFLSWAAKAERPVLVEILEVIEARWPDSTRRFLTVVQRNLAKGFWGAGRCRELAAELGIELRS